MERKYKTAKLYIIAIAIYKSFFCLYVSACRMYFIHCFNFFFKFFKNLKLSLMMVRLALLLYLLQLNSADSQ